MSRTRRSNDGQNHKWASNSSTLVARVMESGSTHRRRCTVATLPRLFVASAAPSTHTHMCDAIHVKIGTPGRQVHAERIQEIFAASSPSILDRALTFSFSLSDRVFRVNGREEFAGQRRGRHSTRTAPRSRRIRHGGFAYLWRLASNGRPVRARG